MEAKNPNEIIKKALANNEPVFVLRAKDKHSVCAMWSYLEACAHNGASQEHCLGVAFAIRDFQEWQKANLQLVKTPD
jgi:hypothetical protein